MEKEMAEEQGGTLIGAVTLRTWRADHTYLSSRNLATPTAIQGRGIGSEVMERAERLARERDIRDVRLDAASR
jgi:N-acetylglutamate synthase-like GNAT family acetyltransferase